MADKLRHMHTHKHACTQTHTDTCIGTCKHTESLDVLLLLHIAADVGIRIQIHKLWLVVS